MYTTNAQRWLFNSRLDRIEPIVEWRKPIDVALASHALVLNNASAVSSLSVRLSWRWCIIKSNREWRYVIECSLAPRDSCPRTRNGGMFFYDFERTSAYDGWCGRAGYAVRGVRVEIERCERERERHGRPQGETWHLVTDIFTPRLTAGNPLALPALNHSIVSVGALVLCPRQRFIMGPRGGGTTERR